MANRTLSVGSAVNDRGATETERRKIITAIGAVLPIGCAFLAGACAWSVQQEKEKPSSETQSSKSATPLPDAHGPVESSFR